jgi:recombinational DNA repair protein RecT
VYAIAKTKDGGIYREVMSKSDIEQVRNVSRAKNAGPWVDWYDEMARKTVIRRIAKRLPSSTDLEKLLEHDNEAIGFEKPALEGIVEEPNISSEPTGLKAAMGIKEEPKRPSLEDVMDAEAKEIDSK